MENNFEIECPECGTKFKVDCDVCGYSISDSYCKWNIEHGEGTSHNDPCTSEKYRWKPKMKRELEKDLNAIGIFPYKKMEKKEGLEYYYKWCAFLENLCKESLGIQDGCKKECRDELIELIKKQTEKKEWKIKLRK